MNKNTVALALLAAGALGGVIYSKHLEISDLKKVAESHQAGARDLAAQLAKANASLDELRKQNEAYRLEAEKLRAMLAESKTAPAAGDGATAAADTAKKENPMSGMMKGVAKMFADPEMRKAMRTQQMMGVRMMYADLLKQLGLTGADSDRFLELLTEIQMETSATAMEMMNGEKKDIKELSNKVEEKNKTYEDQIKGMLGDEKYAQFKEYQGSIGDRMALTQLEGQFSSAGTPFEGTQKDQLLALMREERARDPQAATLAPGNTMKQIEAISTDEGVAGLVNTQSAINQRVLDRARGFLSADQIIALEKSQKQQLEFIRMQVKMSREMLGLNK